MKTNLKELSEEFGHNLKLDCDLKKKNGLIFAVELKFNLKQEN